MVGDPATRARLRVRAEIVLLAADDYSNTHIAESLKVSPTTVSSWRRRFAEGGVQALGDRPRAAGSGQRLGRPAVTVELTDEERAVLEGWCRRTTTAAGLARRARMVLLAADAHGNEEIAKTVGVTAKTVGKWRARFVERGLVGLCDEYRSGRPRTMSDERVEDVVVKTIETKPADGSTHWSTRTMATHVGLSQTSISKIWRTFGLQPHRVKHFKLSTDPNFIDKIHDVCGLYLNPPERAVVFCVDEKSGIQAIDRTQPSMPVLPHSPATATCDYIRNGTVDLFAALNVGTGEVITAIEKRHRTIEFRKFLNQIDAAVPEDLDVHLIADNLSTHKTPTIDRWLKAHPRFTIHFTPTSSSWLNLVERWFSELTTKMLQRSAHANTRQLSTDIIAWAESWNDNPRPYTWTKTADQILESIKQICGRITNSGH
ncbi:MAG: IS630 family transposase [Actinomycetia bacterium]|nr:IS630 family transposase [Actinomycetes bacterium]MCP4963304.1 IS630 family transposase [Actinomycetes bacterium]